MKKIRLSHSAANKYTNCPAMYKYHYIDRIRPIAKGSALFFGNAIDDALNDILMFKHVDVKKITKKKDPLKVALNKFETLWESQFDSKNIEYFKSDILVDKKKEKGKYVKFELDKEFEPFLEEISIFDQEITDHNAFMQECFEILEAKDTLAEDDKELYNCIAWFSLLIKGRMMIEAYYRDIYPQIHTVFDVQKKIELPDEDGNIIIGYIDAIVSFVEAPNVKVNLDNKTSSKPYKEDSVALSPQLGTYCEAEDIERGAYAVMEKDIRKRDPRARTQLIIDKVSEKTLDETFELYENVLEGIQNEEFEKNYDSGCYFFGRTCEYYAYCRSNGKNKKGLEKV